MAWSIFRLPREQERPAAAGRMRTLVSKSFCIDCMIYCSVGLEASTVGPRLIVTIAWFRTVDSLVKTNAIGCKKEQENRHYKNEQSS
jgi:hypothetical protein